MIVTFITLLVFIIALSLVIYRDKIRDNTKMSFKESLDLTDLPIVTFLIGGKRCNFLLDTGASDSLINEKYLECYEHQPAKGSGDLIGLDGAKRTIGYVNMILSYKKQIYEDTFVVTNLDDAFDVIKTETGVILHGVLGNSFMQKYKYIIDFKELVAYR